MVGGGLGERKRLKGKAPIELSDDSSTHAVITSCDDRAGNVNGVQSRDPPLPIVKPTDAFGRPSVHGVGTSIQGERQLDFVFNEVLTPHPNLMSVTGQGRKRGRRRGYPKLNKLPRHSTRKPYEPYSLFERELQIFRNALARKPHEPCSLFERELHGFRNASAEGARLVPEELKMDTGPQCGTGMDSCEGETSADTEGGCFAQCGPGMDACEGEASVNNESGTDHMESSEGETSIPPYNYGWAACRCSDDQLEDPIQFADGPLLCCACFGRVREESTSGESEASYSLPSMDTSSSEESFPRSQVRTNLSSSCDDGVVPVLRRIPKY